MQNSLFAQPNVGASSYYGTKMESFGLNVYGYYPIGEKTKIGLDVVWWPRSAPDNSQYVFTEANIDFQFTPFRVNKFSFYTSLTAGYHYANARVKALGESFASSQHMLAFGAGASVLYDLGYFSVTAKARNFFYSGFNQFNIGGGIQIDI